MDYFDQIDSWAALQPANSPLVFCWKDTPDIELLQYICSVYPERHCYWFIFTTCKTLSKCQSAISQKFPHLDDFVELINPLGVSIYYLTQTIQLWIIEQEIESFFEDFAGDLKQCCFLNFSPTMFSQTVLKPWFEYSPIEPDCSQKVIVVGSGIAGASSAYFLAQYGMAVTLLEQESELAQQASGNYQGVLYAKVSAANTLQNQLLYKAYGFSVSFLKISDPNHEFSDLCGLLHLDYNVQEQKRNLQLAAKNYQLFKSVSAREASSLAGIKIDNSGLFWPFGGWVNPHSWISKICNQSAIKICKNFQVKEVVQNGNDWTVISSTGEQEVAPVIILALGADEQDLYSKLHIRFNKIGGQSNCATANEMSNKLAIVLNAESYISPQFQQNHCFGATFSATNLSSVCSESETKQNFQALSALNYGLYSSFLKENQNPAVKLAHHAVRVDSFDHLPTVGSIGDGDWMKKHYAVLGLDKNIPVTEPCRYLKGLYINTGYGTKGLLTAPLCSLALVSEILNLPNPLGLTLRKALSPNRIIINDIIKKKI